MKLWGEGEPSAGCRYDWNAWSRSAGTCASRIGMTTLPHSSFSRLAPRRMRQRRKCTAGGSGRPAIRTGARAAPRAWSESGRAHLLSHSAVSPLDATITEKCLFICRCARERGRPLSLAAGAGVGRSRRVRASDVASAEGRTFVSMLFLTTSISRLNRARVSEALKAVTPKPKSEVMVQKPIVQLLRRRKNTHVFTAPTRSRSGGAPAPPRAPPSFRWRKGRRITSPPPSGLRAPHSLVSHGGHDSLFVREERR